MNLSGEVLARLETGTGFRAATLEKVLRLGTIAGEITAHPFLGSRLLLKGGTAIQLGLGAPLRLSVDLDYNYVGQLEREAMLRERPEVEDALQRVTRAGGYQVTRSPDEHAGRKLYLGFRSHAGSLERIELDINYQMRQPIGPPVERALWQPGQAPRAMIHSVGDEELWAGKIAALLDRTMPRDLFDVAHLGERSPVGAIPRAPSVEVEGPQRQPASRKARSWESSRGRLMPVIRVQCGGQVRLGAWVPGSLTDDFRTF